ncbi:hypothetical protein HD594_002572 [Microbacterium thalassium]|uniref:Uncharacterized protein n=1 Tax=Microbacterium thalassium TaxID=362649 RepID=A0A7X0FRC1_9MICO|nr:hypothetical protein [Microbacterium thalassium]
MSHISSLAAPSGDHTRDTTPETTQNQGEQ